MTDEDLIRGLYRILTGDIEHVYHGMCPDENDPSLRDVCCPACQLMLIAEEFIEQ